MDIRNKKFGIKETVTQLYHFQASEHILLTWIASVHEIKNVD